MKTSLHVNRRDERNAGRISWLFSSLGISKNGEKIIKIENLGG